MYGMGARLRLHNGYGWRRRLRRCVHRRCGRWLRVRGSHVVGGRTHMEVAVVMVVAVTLVMVRRAPVTICVNGVVASVL